MPVHASNRLRRGKTGVGTPQHAAAAGHQTEISVEPRTPLGPDIRYVNRPIDQPESTRMSAAGSPPIINMARAQMMDTLVDIMTQLEEHVSINNSPAKRAEHILRLAQLVESVYGIDAELLGDFVRECGGVELILEYMADEEPEVR